MADVSCRLEQYSWREHEAHLNEALPQFRTSILLPSAQAPARLHFLHARSAHANAVPLLLIPPFPITNLSLGHLIQPLTDPEDAAVTHPFHVIVPSLPGLGFSDALANNTSLVSTTAAMLDILMGRLGYPHYVASNTGAGATSPSEIDWQIINYLSSHYTDSCLGVHLISPPIQAPTLRESPIEWIKWIFVYLLQRPFFGYTHGDLRAVERSRSLSSRKERAGGIELESYKAGAHGAKEPNTLAYALCDSPVGLLLFVMMLLKVSGSAKQFSSREIITFTEMTWLPGPEGALRFWAHCAKGVGSQPKPNKKRPKAALSVFLGDSDTPRHSHDKHAVVPPLVAIDRYACPTWVARHFDVLCTARVSGQAGMVAWERPEVIFKGVRGLATAILAHDTRMRVAEQPGMALLEQVVVDGGDGVAPAEISGTTVQITPGSASDQPSFPSPLKPATPTKVGDHLAPPGMDARPRTPVSQQADEAVPKPIDTDTSDAGSDPNESSPDTVITVRQTRPAAQSDPEVAPDTLLQVPDVQPVIPRVEVESETGSGPGTQGEGKTT